MILDEMNALFPYLTIPLYIRYPAAQQTAASVGISCLSRMLLSVVPCKLVELLVLVLVLNFIAFDLNFV